MSVESSQMMDYGDHDCLANLRQGTYVLILRLQNQRQLRIGRFGTVPLEAGFYAYVGSALGMGGLTARLRHHLRRARRPHWHIDFLRQVAPIKQIWWTEGKKRLEHIWANDLRKLTGGQVTIKGFGASDCNCESHLIYFPRLPPAGCFVNTSKVERNNPDPFEVVTVGFGGGIHKFHPKAVAIKQ